MAKPSPYVTDPGLQALIDEQSLKADDQLALIEDEHSASALAATLVANEARTYWVGLQILDLIALTKHINNA